MTLLIIGCKAKNKEVIIKGTIIDNKTQELFYSPVFNNTYNNRFRNSVVPDSSGNFIISTQIDQPCFIALSYKSSYKQIILAPGETYEIEVNGKLNQINFISKKGEAQNFYENLPNSNPKYGGFFPRDISDYKSIYKNLNKKLHNELQELNKVKCSEEVRNLIKFERQGYYNLAISVLASLTNEASQRSNEATPSEVMEIWGKALSDTFTTNVQTKKTTYFYDLLDYTLWHKIKTKLNYNNDFRKTRKDKREQGLIHTHTIKLAQDLLSEDNIEFFTATYIMSYTRQNKFEKEFINLFENFKTDFPNSKYTKFIAPKIDKIVDFHKKAAVDFKEECKFVDNYQNLNSLADCLLPFKGKKVYVDIWATYCGPCKQQFEFNLKLKKLLKSRDIEILYISKDSDTYEKRWKDMIKYYDLSGNHIRANAKLKADLRTRIGRFGIPRYLLIDEKGNIVNNNAPRPSNLKKLKKLL